LVPLSGPSAGLGQALLNAAEMALYDIADDHFVLQVYDTEATPEAAARSTARAIAEGAQIILGPVFAADAKAAGDVAAASGVNVVTFSTDPSIARPNVFVLGFLAREQVRQIVGYATSQGHRHFAVLAPDSAYGNAVVADFKEAVTASGGDVTRVGTYSASGSDLEEVIKQVTDYDARKRAGHVERAQLAGKTDDASQAELKRLDQTETAGDVDFDAILLPEQGPQLSHAAALLTYFDVDPAHVQLLGTMLWNTPSLGREPSLVGGEFPAPAPDENHQFEARYRDLYGHAPPTLASHGYDAVALAAALAHSNVARPFAVDTLTASSGFSGVDGIFRFLPNGLSQRGFAILQVSRDGVAVVQPAPTTFQGAQY
jgi:ABC-type branched-subunit amino acid transport system substrate-binding protein